MEHALYLLIYENLHDETAVATCLPWVHAGVRFLRQMREGEPVSSTVVSVRRVLQQMGPNYDLDTSMDLLEGSQCPPLFPNLLASPISPGHEFLDPIGNSISQGASQQAPEQEGLLEGSVDGVQDEFSAIPWLDYNLSDLDIDGFLLGNTTPGEILRY